MNRNQKKTRTGFKFCIFLIAFANALAVKSVADEAGAIKSKVEQAQKLYQTKNYSKVIEILRPIAHELPRNASLILARSYEAQKNYLEEIRILEAIVGENENDYSAQVLIGEANMNLKKYDLAVEHLTSAKEVQPKFAPVYPLLAKAYEIQNQLEDARSVYQDAIKVFGKKMMYLTPLCRLYSIDGLFKEGMDACKLALQTDSKIADNYIYLGQLYIDSESVDRGENMIFTAAKQFPKSELALYSSGMLKFKKKQWSQAAEYFSQATKVDAKSDRCFLALGQTYTEMQKYAEAISALQQACLVNKGNLIEIRRVMANMRQKNQDIWAAKLDNAISRCE